MSKPQKPGDTGPVTRNLVAKHARTFNKAQTHRDKKNDYKRNEKHKGRKFDPYFLSAFSDKYFYEASSHIFQK